MAALAARILLQRCAEQQLRRMRRMRKRMGVFVCVYVYEVMSTD